MLLSKLRPPQFDDSEINARVRWLHGTSLILLIFNFPSVVSLFFGSAERARSETTILLVSSAVALGCIVTIVMLKRRQPLGAATVLISVICAAVIISHVLIFQGLSNPITGAYLMLIVIAGMLLRERGILIVLAICSVAVILISHAESAGRLQPRSFETNMTQLVIILLMLGMTAMLQLVILSTLRRKAQEAEMKSRELAEANDKLQESQVALLKAHAELEQRVEQRTRELTEANMTLKQTQLRFEQLVNNIDEVFWISSPDLSESFYLSPSVNRLVGNVLPPIKEIDPASHQLWLPIIHPNDRDFYLQTVESMANSTVPIDYEFRLLINDQVQWVWSRSVPVFDENENIIARIGTALDITQRKQAEMQLRQSRDSLHLITNNLPALIGHMDRDKNILWLNQAFTSLGADPNNLIGAHLTDVFGQKRYAFIKQYIDTALAGNRVHFEWEYEVSNLGVRILDVLLMPQWVDTVDGREVVGFFSMAQDITQQKQSEEALHRGQRLESLGLLAGGIAHDFNNLLVAMMAQSSLAKAKLDPAHPSQRHIAKSADAAQRAARLTNQMLAYSGRSSFEIKPTNFNDLLNENVNLFKPSLQQGIALTMALSDSLPLVMADTAQVQQLVMNLLINASQAIEHTKGQIVMRTATHTLAEGDTHFWQYTTKELTPGPYVLIEIEDNGKGIDQATLKKIFDPFFTTKGSAGSGLGLSAVIGILRGHRGGLHVISKPNQGTRFQLIFPEYDAQYEAELVGLAGHLV